MSSPQKRSVRSFDVHRDESSSSTHSAEMKRAHPTLPLPLTTSKLANKLPHESPKKLNPDAKTEQHDDVLGELMAKLNEQQNIKHDGGVPLADDVSSQDTDPFANTPPAGSTATSDSNDTTAMENMKRQLELATERMAQMELELTQSRARQTSEQQPELTQPRIHRATAEQSASASFHSTSQAYPFASLLGTQVTYSNDSRRASPLDLNSQQQALAMHGGFQSGTLAPPPLFTSQNEGPPLLGRPSSAFASRPVRLTPPQTPFNQNFNHAQLNQIYGQQANASGQPLQAQAPIGTRLSPTASDFSGPWPMPAHQQVAQQGQHYMSTVEPLNYRRLLDRDMSCNWRYIVDKIVCSNDQQASIFLQQKLKLGTPEQKFEIVEAIIAQAYPLMINRFGNFLVQRCFEHGTPEQVVHIAQAIRGNTLNLSMDAFGCHVVQKAFDSVPEEYKAIMVHELLRRIPETVIHRYACHVWQKLFELRWSGSPPQIMTYVNEALRGMWHEVALGETGSLVVQNIFENCLDEDKRPCISEVLASIDVVAHGQFGNWCIQHICEHGALPDRNRAVDHVLRFATEYSMDQFASKVVEKCLKIGGSDFLDRYLDVVCEARPDRPRMPLVDIAGDQFGNYLVQYILANADAQRREIVAAHIRKHMVSLRGSKYGSRVAMLCCNPAYTTRPGPPAGVSRNNSRYPEQPGFDAGGRQYNNNNSDRGYIGMGRGGNYR